MPHHFTQELWRDIPGYEDAYQVSNFGHIASLARLVYHKDGRIRKFPGKTIQPLIDKKGYEYVNLYTDGRQRHYAIHRLVLMAWLGEPQPWQEACHNDGNPRNNHKDNLRWDTRKNNHADKKRHGTHRQGESHHNSRLKEFQIRSIRADTRPCKIIAKDFSISFQYVCRIKLRQAWDHI